MALCSFKLRPAFVVASRVMAGTAVFAGLAGIYAFKVTFARTGEAALRLVPADAEVVGSIDLVPSPAQALAFKRIDDALARNGMDQFPQKGMLSTLDRSPAVEQLNGFTSRDAAFALLPTRDQKPETGFALIWALSDGRKAEQILSSTGYKRFWKGAQYYVLPKGEMGYMVVDDLLVISAQPWALREVSQVATGNAPSILTDKEFVRARTQLAEDANVMVLASPAVTQTGPGGRRIATNWVAGGLAIRDGGIEMNAFAPLDPEAYPVLKRFGSSAPLRPDLLQAIPQGAYGMTAVSQPSNFIRTFEEESGDSKAVDEARKGAREGLGVDLDTDITPALDGDAIIAAYPCEGQEAGGIDFLAVLDDSNGADPAGVARKVQEYINKKIGSDGKYQKLYEGSADGNRFLLAPDIAKDMQGSIGKGMEHTPAHRDMLIKDKTMAWAYAGHAVIVASSESLLDRAVAAYQTHSGGLDSDARLLAAAPRNGAQQLLAVSVSRVAQGIENTIDTSSMAKKDVDTLEGVLGAFKALAQPLDIQSTMGPQGLAQGSLFVPLDYDKLIDLAGTEINKHK